MNRFIYSVNRKFTASALALIMAAFFLVAPASAQNYYQNYYIEFWADQTQIYRGECINIYWDTNNVQTVHYNNRPVSGINQTRVECPTTSTVYNLLVTLRDGRQVHRQIYVEVLDPPPGWSNWYDNMIIDFWADRTQIRAGECVNIYWNTNNVQTVHYNGQGVNGIHQTRVECPDESTTYDLLVRTRNNQQILRQIHVEVVGSSFDQGELVMHTEEMVDLDDDGNVSRNEDDFRWIWAGGERGVIVKADDDRDLELTVAEEEGSSGEFDRLSRNDCEDELDDDDSPEVGVKEGTILCFRSDDGNYGKARVEDIRSTNGRLVVDWYIWR